MRQQRILHEKLPQLCIIELLWYYLVLSIISPVSSRSTLLTIFSLPLRQKDYTPEIIIAISHILSVNLSRFNVGTGHGLNREWEVGNKSLYNDLDTKNVRNKNVYVKFINELLCIPANCVICVIFTVQRIIMAIKKASLGQT